MLDERLVRIGTYTVTVTAGTNQVPAPTHKIKAGSAISEE
jgi:hypothetical protein